jgi:hypothetical protein
MPSTTREITTTIDIARMRETLGLSEAELPDDATDEQINDALAKAGSASGPPPVREPSREERQEQRDASEFLSKAVRAGKFPAARFDHYSALMSRDPEGTREFVEALPEGLPVRELGSMGGLGDAEKAAYPESWLTPGERAQIAKAQEAQANGRVNDVAPGQIIREG